MSLFNKSQGGDRVAPGGLVLLGQSIGRDVVDDEALADQEKGSMAERALELGPRTAGIKFVKM